MKDPNTHTAHSIGFEQFSLTLVYHSPMGTMKAIAPWCAKLRKASSQSPAKHVFPPYTFIDISLYSDDLERTNPTSNATST